MPRLKTNQRTGTNNSGQSTITKLLEDQVRLISMAAVVLQESGHVILNRKTKIKSPYINEKETFFQKLLYADRMFLKGLRNITRLIYLKVPSI
jgi:hypothetical protein